jgi:hypothetical protein
VYIQQGLRRRSSSQSILSIDICAGFGFGFGYRHSFEVTGRGKHDGRLQVLMQD